MIMPLNQTQLNIFQVFYFVHMGDSLKSFKIEDYKLSIELLFLCLSQIPIVLLLSLSDVLLRH